MKAFFGPSSHLQFCAITSALFAAFLASCVTTPPQPPVELPAYLQPLFGNCKGIEGVSGLRVFDGENFLGSAELEYQSDPAGLWTVRLSDAMGPELLQISGPSAPKGAMRVEGPLSARVPSLSVTDEQFVLVDGNFTGIRQDEVPCFASFHFPQAWLKNLRKVERSEGVFTGLIVDESRSIDLRFQRDQKGGFGLACAHIQSVGLLRSFRAQWKWCTGGQGKPWAVLDGFRNYVIKWSSYE